MTAADLERLRPARARIDLDRLRDNYRAVAAFAGRPVMPVVKADGYGHGALGVARALVGLGAPMLAVAYTEEAAALRAAGMDVPIVVMAGFGPAQASALVQNRLVPVVSSEETLEIVERAARKAGHRLEVHLKVDTGMTRLGFAPVDAPGAATRLLETGMIEVAGVMTQLAAADEDRDFTARQLDLFDETVGALAARGIRPRFVHAANSAGLRYLRPTHTLVRPGLILYGVRPRPLAPEIDVKPVMTVGARIGLVRDTPPGTSVSYGRRFSTARPSRIAVVPMGYADGVPRTRAMAERGAWRVEGGQAPVAGTVCMDLTMLDVTDRPAAGVGSDAVLLGDEPDAWQVADWAGTNAWQVLTGIGSRVPRVYVENGTVVSVESRY